MSGGLVAQREQDCRTLLLQIARREEHAFEALYDRYGRLVLGMAMRLVPELIDAEDVTQDVFLELWRQPPNAIGGSRSLIAWLARVTRTRCWRARRSKRVGVSIDESREETFAYSDPCFSRIFDEQLRERVQTVFPQVAGAGRTVLELAWLHGLGPTQISRELGLPLVTVRRHVEKGADRLRRMLGRRVVIR